MKLFFLKGVLNLNWKTKALIQNAIAFLPKDLSYKLYFLIQSKFGGLQNINHLYYLKAAKNILDYIMEFNHSPVDKTFFELGTGRIVMLPMCYWLTGAKKIITVDLNPYLVEDLVLQNVKYLLDNEKQVLELFAGLIQKERWELLKNFVEKEKKLSLGKVLNFFCIEYLAPCDAANTKLPSSTIDFHTSYTVLEHIPKEIIQKIFTEGNKIIKPDGLFIHEIDYSDHFAHSDNSISLINFLKYSDFTWNLFAGNKYMYMNRLRHDDFVDLYGEFKHKLLKIKTDNNTNLYDQLENMKIVVDEKFKQKSNNILCITGACIVSKKID